MIQRIQSLFLLFVVILSALLLVIPVYAWSEADPGGNTVLKQFLIPGNALLMIIDGSIGVLALVAIFLYRYRNLQIRLCNLEMLLTCILTGLLFFVADTMSSSLNQQVHYKAGSYLPLIQLVFLFVAGRFIRRDEELVRSSDRLR